MANSQDKILDLVNLVLTITWYTFNLILSFTSKLMMLRWDDQVKPQHKFIYKLINKCNINGNTPPSKNWETIC